MVDSGVATGSQISLRESGSERSEFPVTFGIQAARFASQPAAASNLIRNPQVMQEGVVAPLPTQMQNLPSVFFDPVIKAGLVRNWGDQGHGFDRGLDTSLGPDFYSISTLQGFGDILGEFSEPFTSALLDPVFAELDWNWGVTLN
jgi:hypothetical protein